MSRESFRVYFVTHDDGHLSGILLRQWDAFFDSVPPAAYGESEDDVLLQLAVQLQERLADGEEMQRYLWKETLSLRRATIEVHPQTVVKKRPVIGKQRIPLKLSYVTYPHPGGGFRVLLPRFGWWLLVEELEIAGETLRNAVSSALLGEKPRWLYDFRREGEEYVREWDPAGHAASAAQVRKAVSVDDVDDLSECFPALLSVAEELVTKAARGKLPRLLGGEAPLHGLEPRLKAYPPPSLLLVGPSGVGKSSWVSRLAQTFLRWRRQKIVADPPRIWRTSAERLIGGMVYLGQWQERIFTLVEELGHEGDYLCVDRLTGVLAQQPDGATILDLLAPALEAREISLIAECSEAELEACRRRAPRLLAQFEVVRLSPTPPAEMLELLAQYQQRKDPARSFHATALRQLAHYLELFRRDQVFPGKGIHFIDWLAQQRDGLPSVLYPTDVAEAFSRYSGLPAELIADDRPLGVEAIRGRLAAGVIGQDAACAACAGVLARFKARLNDPDKPLGSLMFVGPTGVGKTELCKQVTRYLFGDDKRLIRLDMSEYMSPAGAARLTSVSGAGTSLAERLRQQPLSVVLFDEIEKAHPQVFDVLLGILGEGRLTDDLGRLVDLRMTLILMTSNLGVSETAPVGFGDRVQDDFLMRVKQHFRPEFFNRLDAVQPFTALRPAHIEAIVELELAKAQRRRGLSRRKIRLRATAAAKALLAQRGFHPTRGARPLKRTLEEQVLTPLAVLLAREHELCEVDIPVIAADDTEGAEVDPHAKVFDQAALRRAIYLGASS
jgi:ATP-dependent Clp protease ATP-binding subunit ClpC